MVRLSFNSPGPPQLAASFISGQTGNVACWHLSDLLILAASVGYEGVKRKWLGHRQTGAIDPDQTSCGSTVRLLRFPVCYRREDCAQERELANVEQRLRIKHKRDLNCDEYEKEIKTQQHGRMSRQQRARIPASEQRKHCAWRIKDCPKRPIHSKPRLYPHFAEFGVHNVEYTDVDEQDGANGQDIRRDERERHNYPHTFGQDAGCTNRAENRKQKEKD
jgi:hypothetical protein